MKNRISNIVWGLLLILVGVGYAGNTLGFWEFTLFFRGWWTLFIIIPCLISFIRRGANGGNVAGLLIGAAFLLSAWDVIDLSLLRRLLIPLILILPQFMSDKLFAVFCAEPVADFLAAATTTTLFLFRFRHILRETEQKSQTRPE